jgi:hypothetical protein
MSQQGTLKIQRRNITGTPPANAIAIKMTVDNFLAALCVRRDGDTVALYVDPALSQQITSAGKDPLRLTLLVEYPERAPTPQPQPAKVELGQKPSDTKPERPSGPEAKVTPIPKAKDLW